MRNKFKPTQFKPVMFSVGNDENVVTISIDTQLETQRSIYSVDLVTNNPVVSMLLQERLNDVMREHEKHIARNCIAHLKPEEISDLKRRLKNWHGSKHCWFK